jgi:hypothetical protein
LTAEVLVPIDTPLWVNYINWTEEQPNIYYQYGVSEEFIVTKDTPKRIKIWIDTEINPDYPFEAINRKSEEDNSIEELINDNSLDESSSEATSSDLEGRIIDKIKN